MRLWRLVVIYVLTVLAVVIMAPLATALGRSSAGYDFLFAAGEAAGTVIPRGSWTGNGAPDAAFPVPRLLVIPGGTGIMAAYQEASCIPGGGPANLTVPVSALVSAAVFPLVVWGLGRRHGDLSSGRPCRMGAFIVPLSGGIGLFAGVFELALRIYWMGAEARLGERSLFFDSTGEYVMGGGWLLLHGNVLALTLLPLWLLRAGVWGLALLLVTAVAGWKPARRPVVACAWAAACLMLLASPWWLAYFIGPLWIA